MFIKNENGFVLAFMAILLPIFMLVAVLIIDGGNLYIRHDQIRNLAKEGANSGILTLGEILENQAENNFNLLCNTEFPPPKCDSGNVFDFLTSSEIQNLILNIGNQNQIKNAAASFVKNFDPQGLLTSDDIIVSFPYEYSGGDEVKILVKIETQVKGFFMKIIPGNRQISVESKSFLTLQ